MRLGPTSVRARLTLWYTVVLSLLLVAFAATSYAAFARTLRSRTDAFISDALSVFGREVVAERREIPSVLDAHPRDALRDSLSGPRHPRAR